ncbi:MAG: hypothetical protein R3E79_13675 [Caldilineaceae bacterium]
MKQTPFHKLTAFLDKLEVYTIPYTLTRVREEALLVNVAVPGERWEIEFMADGSVEIERFCSSGPIEDEHALAELFMRYAEPTNGVYTPAGLTEPVTAA